MTGDPTADRARPARAARPTSTTGSRPCTTISGVIYRAVQAAQGISDFVLGQSRERDTPVKRPACEAGRILESSQTRPPHPVAGRSRRQRGAGRTVCFRGPGAVRESGPEVVK